MERACAGVGGSGRSLMREFTVIWWLCLFKGDGMLVVNAVPNLQESCRSVPTLLGRCRSLEKDRET